MAGILIRGMEMPECCDSCQFEGAVVDLYCELANKVVPPSGIMQRPSWCPIIALPDGHGRLIDAGKLMKHYAWWGENDEQRELFDEIIDQQKTIVPAEEEDT